VDKAGYIRIIEIDEAIYQLNLILKQGFYVNGTTFNYINNKINELQIEKQKLYDT
jgi:hypothetical protein